MPLRAIVFDFDGLIADTEWPEYRAVAEQFERHGLEYPPAGWARVLGTAWSVDWPADLPPTSRPGCAARSTGRSWRPTGDDGANSCGKGWPRCPAWSN